MLFKKENCCGEKVKPFTKHSFVSATKSVIKHFISPSYNAFVSDEIKKFRKEQCEKCEKMRMFLGKPQCSVCNCFIDAKASLVDQECPHPLMNKWKYVNDKEKI